MLNRSLNRRKRSGDLITAVNVYSCEVGAQTREIISFDEYGIFFCRIIRSGKDCVKKVFYWKSIYNISSRSRNSRILVLVLSWIKTISHEISWNFLNFHNSFYFWYFIILIFYYFISDLKNKLGSTFSIVFIGTNRLYYIEMYIHTFSPNSKIAYEQRVNRLMKKWGPWSNQIKLYSLICPCCTINLYIYVKEHM